MFLMTSLQLRFLLASIPHLQQPDQLQPSPNQANQPSKPNQYSQLNQLNQLNQPNQAYQLFQPLQPSQPHPEVFLKPIGMSKCS